MKRVLLTFNCNKLIYRGNISLKKNGMSLAQNMLWHDFLFIFRLDFKYLHTGVIREGMMLMVWNRSKPDLVARIMIVIHWDGSNKEIICKWLFTHSAILYRFTSSFYPVFRWLGEKSPFIREKFLKYFTRCYRDNPGTYLDLFHQTVVTQQYFVLTWKKLHHFLKKKVHFSVRSWIASKYATWECIRRNVDVA